MSSGGAWVTRGFEAFRRGTFGNAGQNLYVSRGGVLQRIHQYDLTHNGYYDLVLCNSQAHCERVPAFLFRDVLGKRTLTHLLAEGATAGTVCDLNGDGYDDLIIGCMKNGITIAGSNAHIYYGSPDGWSEAYQIRLPAPKCSSVAAGDFAGNGRASIAFLLDGVLRLFDQDDLGFQPDRFIDFRMDGLSVDAGDLDADGCCDLLLRKRDGSVLVHWGSSDGLALGRASLVPPAGRAGAEDGPSGGVSREEYVADANPLARMLCINETRWVFVPSPQEFHVVPAESDRSFGSPLTFDCPSAYAAAVGDIDGDGIQDLVVACRQPVADHTERSWVYWGSREGLDPERRTPFETYRACDVATGDLDGDGRDEIAVCCNKTSDYYTHESTVLKFTPDRTLQSALRMETHDARRVFVTHCSDDTRSSLVFINHFSGTAADVIPSFLYTGGPGGYSSERRFDIPASGAVEAIYADLNDDGWADLVMVNASEYSNSEEDAGSYVLLNRKPGFPQDPDVVLPTSHAHGGACADLNRDGYLDLVFGGFGCPDLLFFYGTASGFAPGNVKRLRLEHDGVVYDDPRWIYLADFNNDGWLDLFVPQVASERSFVLWGGPEGFSMDRVQFLVCRHAACARAADLTGNGYLDLIIGGHRQTFGGPADSFVYIYWNGPKGMSEHRKMLLPADTVNAMALGDFNGNGTLDLFAGSYATTREREVPSFIYWNRPGRGFSADDRSRLQTHSASGCIACDFNRDGYVDLAVANHKVNGDHTGWSVVYWNGPDGFDEKRITRLPTMGPHGITSVAPGNIVDRGAEEYYVSAPYRLPAADRASTIAWSADTPEDTWVHAQVRWAESVEDLIGAAWNGAGGAETWYRTSAGRLPNIPAGSWIQYRLALGAVNGLRSPRVHEVRVGFG